MTRHARLVAAAAIAVATCLGSLALAQQPKKPGSRSRPKPPAAAAVQADASSAEGKANEDESHASGSAGEGGSGAVATPADYGAPGEGGVRASPLNPAPSEMPSSATVDAGSIDYDRLLSDIAALRTRVAAVGESLFQSRMAIALRVEGDHARVAKVSVAVDDGAVYTSPQGFRGDELTPVFARALAPGRHAVTVDVDREDVDNVAFKTSQRSRFIVEVQRDEQLDVALRIEDDSSMATLPGKKKGEYDLRVRMKATSGPIKR